MSYALNIAFSNDQLNTLYETGSNVIVAKPTSGSATNVAWQVFKPMQANTLSWDEEYGIYVSTVAVSQGAELLQLSSTPVNAAMGQLYTLQDSGAISDPVATGGTTGSFSLLNQYSNKDYMTVGLYQDATVNGTQIVGNALSAAPTLLQSTAVMTPYTTVYVWLQSEVQSNCVVTNVTSPMTAITFGGSTFSVSVHYDSASGMFVAGSA